jgi:hypothetical protein
LEKLFLSASALGEKSIRPGRKWHPIDQILLWAKEKTITLGFVSAVQRGYDVLVRTAGGASGGGATESGTLSNQASDSNATVQENSAKSQFPGEKSAWPSSGPPSPPQAGKHGVSVETQTDVLSTADAASQDPSCFIKVQTVTDCAIV